MNLTKVSAPIIFRVFIRFVLLLGLVAIAELTVSFVTSVRVPVCLSARMEQIGFHRTDFYGIIYKRIFRRIGLKN